MATSASHHRLLAAIEQLRVALLPAVFDATGTYADADQTHLRAVSFRVLVHAEIEAFLEDIASSLFQEAWSAWDKRGVPSRVMIGLLAFSGREHDGPPVSLKDQSAVVDPKPCLHKAQSVWRHVHGQNHGLKEENVLRLLLPLGVSADAIDPTLLSDLSSFGASRGEVAHASTTRLTQRVDPKTEYERARQLAADLLKLDDLVTRSIEEVRLIDVALAGRAPSAATGSTSGSAASVASPIGGPAAATPAAPAPGVAGAPPPGGAATS